MDGEIIKIKKNLNNSNCYCINLENMTIQKIKGPKMIQSPLKEENDNEKEKENDFLQNNYLTRKTFRGRKEKLSLPKNKIKCGICLEFYNSSSKELVSCFKCKCLFHYSCYNQCELSILKEKIIYKCIRCSYAIKINKNIYDFHCFICGGSNGVLNKNHITNEFYHQICLNLINELKGLEDADISIEEIRKWRYKNSCRYCGEKLTKYKAVIKCKNPKCKQYFHIPCAIEKGIIFDLNFMKKYYNVSDFSEIPFYCSNHNKKLSMLYKTYILNEKYKEKNQKNSNIKMINNNKQKVAFLEPKNEIKKTKTYKNKKNSNKNINKEKSKTKILFVTTKNNILNSEEENNNIIFMNNNKENIPIHKKANNIIKENKDNSFDENNNNDIFNIDFEKLIKDSMNKNLFIEDLKTNSPLYKNEKEDNIGKEVEDNSLFFLH